MFYAFFGANFFKAQNVGSQIYFFSMTGGKDGSEMGLGRLKPEMNFLTKANKYSMISQRPKKEKPTKRPKVPPMSPTKVERS